MTRSNDTTRVLGIDPGSRKAGWGVVDIHTRTRKIVHVDNGVLMLDVKAPLTERLVDLSRRIHSVVESYRPTIAAVEDVYVDKGIRSALTLGQARGAVLATIGLCGLKVEGHTATQVKQRVTGRGRASKEQVNEMVCNILGLPEQPFEDAADALAVAICQGMNALAPVALQIAVTSVSTTRTLSVTTTKRRGRAGLEAIARAQGKLP